MQISIDISPQRIPLFDTVPGVIELIAREDLLRSALKAQQMIKTRTGQGRDVNNDLFAPYSSAYSVFRAEKGLPVNKVDLFFRGNMMASMQAEAVSQGEARISFRSQFEGSKAAGHQAGLGRLPQRRFFELNQVEVDDLADFLNEQLATRLSQELS